jgi:hypothetical protein
MSRLAAMVASLLAKKKDGATNAAASTDRSRRYIEF